jgi:hypothetical protein
MTADSGRSIRLDWVKPRTVKLGKTRKTAVHRYYPVQYMAVRDFLVCFVGFAFFANMSLTLDLLVTRGYQEGLAAHAHALSQIPSSQWTRVPGRCSSLRRSSIPVRAAELKAAQGHRMVHILKSDS